MPDPLVLEGLAAEVKVDVVDSLLLGRAPSFLDPNDSRHDSYLQVVKGVATEVTAVVGSDPQPPVRDLAVWAITLGAAAYIEASLAPEQQLGGEDGAADVLQRRFLGVLAQLRGLPGVAAAGALPTAGPRGSFPAARAYPDPVEVDPPRWSSL